MHFRKFVFLILFLLSACSTNDISERIAKSGIHTNTLNVKIKDNFKEEKNITSESTEGGYTINEKHLIYKIEKAEEPEDNIQYLKQLSFHVLEVTPETSGVKYFIASKILSFPTYEQQFLSQNPSMRKIYENHSSSEKKLYFVSEFMFYKTQLEKTFVTYIFNCENILNSKFIGLQYDFEMPENLPPQETIQKVKFLLFPMINVKHFENKPYYVPGHWVPGYYSGSYYSPGYYSPGYTSYRDELIETIVYPMQ